MELSISNIICNILSLSASVPFSTTKLGGLIAHPLPPPLSLLTLLHSIARKFVTKPQRNLLYRLYLESSTYYTLCKKGMEMSQSKIKSPTYAFKHLFLKRYIQFLVAYTFDYSWINLMLCSDGIIQNCLVKFCAFLTILKCCKLVYK